MSMFARMYDLSMMFVERWKLGELRESVVSPARGRVVEIGAGSGLNFPHYSTAAWVVASDPDPDMLDRARDRARKSTARVVLVQADAQALPFTDHVFDEAVVALALCTIPDPLAALEEIGRTLKRGGVLRLIEHVRIDHPAVAGRVQDMITPVWRHIAAGCHLNRRPAADVVAAGFVLERTAFSLGGYIQTITARTR